MELDEFVHPALHFAVAVLLVIALKTWGSIESMVCTVAALAIAACYGVGFLLMVGYVVYQWAAKQAGRLRFAWMIRH